MKNSNFYSCFSFIYKLFLLLVNNLIHFSTAFLKFSFIFQVFHFQDDLDSRSSFYRTDLVLHFLVIGNGLLDSQEDYP